MLLDLENSVFDRGFVPNWKASDAILTIGLPGQFGKPFGSDKLTGKPL
jgi:hypothetical protein